MADNNGLQVLAGIVPKNQADTFATHFSKYGQGGRKEVQNTGERDAITPERRTIGMQVYVIDENNTYYLKDGIANSNWTNLLFMSAEVNPIDALGNFGLDQRQFNIVPQVSSDNCNLYGQNFSFAIDPFNSNNQFGNGNNGGLTFFNAFASHNANGNFGSARGINIGYSLGNGSSTGTMVSLIGLTIANSMQSGYTLGNYTGIALFENFATGSNLQYYNGIQLSPNLNSAGLQYAAGLNINLNLYNAVNGGVNVINTQSNAQAGSNSNYWVDVQAGTNFRDGGATDNYTGVNVSPSFENSSLVNHFTGVNISPNSPAKLQQSATGLNINMGSVVMATPGINNRPISILAQNGVKNIGCQATSEAGAFFDNINLDVVLFTVEAGKPITGTEILADNKAVLLLAQDDLAAGPLGLGFVKTLAGGQYSIALGKTVEKASNYVSGVSVPPQVGDGGTITNHYDFRSIGIFDLGGGNLNVTNFYSFYMEAAANASFPAANCWGLYIADPTAENFLKKSLTIGGSTGKVSNASIALQIADKKALALEPMTTVEINALTMKEGMIVANGDSKALNYCNGTIWKEIAFV